MKRLLMATVAFVSFGSVAYAADLPVKAPAAAGPYVAPLMGPWTGIYIGGQIGYGWNWTGTDLSAGGTTLATLGDSPQGITGGFKVGADYQTGAIVWGIVGDINLANFSNSSSMVALGPVTISNSTNWWSTINGRIGLSTLGDHLLPYFVGGLAFGQAKASVDLGTASFSSSPTNTGWDAGLGIETRITKNWSVFIEGKYVNMGNVVVPLTSGGVTLATADKDVRFGVVEGGVQLRF